MLEKFIGKKSLLFVPVAWLNSVANLLTTMYSPKRTIIVRLEGVGEGANLAFDINPEAVAKAIVNELAGEFVKKGDCGLLGEGLEWTQRGLSINKDWFRQQVIQGEKN